MTYYVKNKSGGISKAPKKLYDYLKGKDDYECWTEDPYENLPKEVETISYPIPDEKGSWFTLSDGSRVNGEDRATAAQKALDNG